MLTKKEKLLFLVLVILFLSSSIFLAVGFYYHHTVIGPARGGTYIEGIIGSPGFINPIYLAKNDVDRDLVELIFSGLMKYNSEGKIVPDLAADYPKISNDGKTYDIHLKENAYFHDGKKVTADDVIFTIQSIQNPDFKSPLRANWLGVQVTKVSPEEIKFQLPNPYPGFIENLTLKILPSHIWDKISPAQTLLSSYNFQPIGSGPYKLTSTKQDKSGRISSIELSYFKKYYDPKPYISKIIFSFFKDKNSLLSAAQNGYVDGFSLPQPLAKSLDNFNAYEFSQPRYFAVFFNLEDKDKLFTDKRVREALNYATNKEEILKQIALGHGRIIDSPILPDIYHYNQPSITYKFDLDKAKSLLQQAGFIEENGAMVKKIPGQSFHFSHYIKYGDKGQDVTNLQKCLSKLPDADKIYPEKIVSGYFGKKTKEAVIRFQEKYSDDILKPIHLTKGTGDVKSLTIKKLNEVCVISPGKTVPLKISLSTGDDATLQAIAQLLQEQWKKLGIDTEIKTYSVKKFDLEKNVIEPRQYQALLFGEALKMKPDLFPFWHSSQILYPGLNLSEYKNKKVDTLLQSIKQETDNKKLAEEYDKLQNIIISDSPAIFLYRPNYIYQVSKTIKGIQTGKLVDPSQRFCQVSHWYIKTTRIWKK